MENFNTLRHRLPFCGTWAGLSESFEVDSWVVKVSGQSGIFYFKNTIHKEMPSRVASRYLNQVGGDFRWQPADFWQPWHG